MAAFRSARLEAAIKKKVGLRRVWYLSRESPPR